MNDVQHLVVQDRLAPCEASQFKRGDPHTDTLRKHKVGYCVINVLVVRCFPNLHLQRMRGAENGWQVNDQYP